MAGPLHRAVLQHETLASTSPDMARRMVFMSGDVINEHFNEFLKRNGRICLPKPFSLDQFRSAVGSIGANN